MNGSAPEVDTPFPAVAIRHRVGGDPPPTRVIVLHPGRQHAQEVVLAAQHAAILQRFVTSYYWGDNDPVAGFVRRLTGSRSLEVRYLRRRWNPEIHSSLVTSFPHYHLAARLASPIARTFMGR